MRTDIVVSIGAIRDRKSSFSKTYHCYSNRLLEGIGAKSAKESRDDSEVYIIVGSTWHCLLVKSNAITPNARGRSSLIREHKKELAAGADKLPGVMYQYMGNFVKLGSWQ